VGGATTLPIGEGEETTTLLLLLDNPACSSGTAVFSYGRRPAGDSAHAGICR
jgi:hypothetical protein